VLPGLDGSKKRKEENLFRVKIYRTRDAARERSLEKNHEDEEAS